jgi:hypothetical protein
LANALVKNPAPGAQGVLAYLIKNLKISCVIMSESWICAGKIDVLKGKSKIDSERLFEND